MGHQGLGQKIVRQREPVLGLLPIKGVPVLLGIATHEELPSGEEDHLGLDG